MKLRLLTLAFFIIGPAAESQGPSLVCTQSCCSELPVDGCPVESVGSPGLERHGVEHRVIAGVDCFCGKTSKLFVPSQERWAVTESLFFWNIWCCDKKGSK